MEAQQIASPARDHRLAYIDALRGYAILAVVAVHSLVMPDLEWPLRLLAEQGARGVQLFFVVSALTLNLSWHERADGTGPFLLRRIFRVGPMFWLAMLFVLTTEAAGLDLTRYRPSTVSWFTVLTTATFTHGFHPQTISSIVPGGWSIADEMTFYVILPLLMAILRSWKGAAVALVAALCLSLLMALLAHQGYLFPALAREPVEQFVFLSFPNQLPSFVGGILLFHLLRTFPRELPRQVLRAALMVAFAMMLAIPFAARALHPYMPHTAYLMPMVYTPPLVLLTWCLAKGGGAFMVNRASRYIGKISYSMYFWHFPVIGLLAEAMPLGASEPAWLRFLLLYVVAVVLSGIGASLTYRLVEQPMIQAGRQLAARLASRRGSTAPPERSVEEAI